MWRMMMRMLLLQKIDELVTQVSWTSLMVVSNTSRSMNAWRMSVLMPRRMVTDREARSLYGTLARRWRTRVRSPVVDKGKRMGERGEAS